MENNFVITHIDDVKRYGPIRALIIGVVKSWCKTNHNKKGYVHDGHSWSGHITIDEFSELTGLKKDAVATNLKWLVDNNIVIKGVYNKKKFDRTGWYRFNPALPEMHLGSNGICISGETLNGNRVIPEMEIGSNPMTIPTIQPIIQSISQPTTQPIIPVELTKFEKEQLLLVLDNINAPDRVLSLVRTLITDGAGYLTSRNRELILQNRIYFNQGKLLPKVIQQLE